MIRTALALLSIQLTPTTADPAAILFLTCETDVRLMANTERESASVSDNGGNAATASGVKQGLVDYHVVVDFRMSGGSAEVRVPPDAVDIGSAQKNGWIPLKDLVVTDTEISGTAKTGLLRKSRFHIDRVSGIMTTERGLRAPCRKIEQSQRAF